ncbi:MAG: transporter substrate-binding domain-containing protein [Bacteriovorax sp.]|nr:transporter substrate-binding domain-containing protein [Bacteriovorax sp.]
MKLLTLFIALTFIPAGYSQTELTDIVLPNNRTITVTGHPDYPPVVWVKKDTKELEGIAVELLTMILKEANIKVVFTNVDTWGRAQEEVKAGRIDILLPPYKTEERVQLYNYAAETFMMDETVVFVRKGQQFKFEEFKDLLIYPGVAIINDSFGTKFDEFEKANKNLTRLPTTEQCFRFVEKKRARYVIAGINSGKAALTKLMLNNKYIVLPKRIIVTGLYAPVSLKSPWNTPQFNAFLRKKFQEYETNGTVKSLEKKYWNILKQENQTLSNQVIQKH